MIETFDFVNIQNQTWHFNTDTCPLTSFVVDGSTRMTDRPRMQQHGDWEGFNYLDHDLLHIEGDILRDTTEAYIADRLAIMDIICPPPGRQNTRRWGKINLKYYGQEMMTANCTGDSRPSMPLQGLYPTVGPFQISFKIFDPFWTGVISGNRYLI